MAAKRGGKAQTPKAKAAKAAPAPPVVEQVQIKEEPIEEIIIEEPINDTSMEEPVNDTSIDESVNESKTEGESNTELNETTENPANAAEDAKKEQSKGAEKADTNAAKTNHESEADASKPSEDALVLSAEEEAEIAAESTESSKGSQKIKKDPPKSKNVWVSNISRGSKAADLKKLFSEKFKVESAKVVTNGRSYFGYMSLETPEMAQDAVKELDGTTLNGKKISVSLNRPDLRPNRGNTDSRRRDSRRETSRVVNGVKKSDDAKKSDAKKSDSTKKSESGTEKKDEKKGETVEKKDGEETDADKDAKDKGSIAGSEKKKEDPEEEERRQMRRKELRTQRMIQDLKTDLKRVSTELSNNRRRLTETTRRLDAERDRKLGMRREIEKLEAQLKSERRKFTMELEQMERKRKSDEARYHDDRAALNRELDECRKLREYLQRKIDDVGISSGGRHGGRSPPRRGGPHSGSGGRGSRIQSDGRGGRSTPPPPKINRRSRERSPPPYKGSKKPRVDDGPYGTNHYQGPSSYQGGPKQALMSYPQGSSGGVPREAMFATTAYPVPQRYGSGYPSGGYNMGGGNPAPMMRPMGYPDPRGSGQRKY